MSVELFYAPDDEAGAITLDDLIGRLAASGFPCTVEPDSEGMSWIVFGGHESALLASVDEGRFVGGTLQVAFEDNPSVIEGIDAVLREAGYSAGDESEPD